MKRKRKVFFVLKTDKGAVKVLIEEKGFKDFKIVVILCLCLLRAVIVRNIGKTVRN